MKNEAEIREGIKSMTDSHDSRLPIEQEKLVSLLAKKEDLMKRIAYTEADITKKEKELKSKKR